MPDKTQNTTNNKDSNKKIIEPLPKKEATIPVKPNYIYEQKVIFVFVTKDCGVKNVSENMMTF